MKFKNLIIGSVALSSMLFAGGSTVPIPEVEEVIEANAWSFELTSYMHAAGMKADMGFKKIDEFTFLR